MMNNQLDPMSTRYPLGGTFELTLRCNLHCRMCLFRRSDKESVSMMQEELSADEWIDMARQAAEAGTLNLLITGGEPMLRRDFCEIWEGIYRYGFLIQLYTNATMVTDEIMECLRQFPPHRIGVTVYGSNPDIYKKVTGSADAYDRMCEGVKKLMTLPSVINFRSTIIRDNYRDVYAIEALIRDQFGYQGVVSEPRSVFPSVRGGTSEARIARLSPEDNVRLFFRRGVDYLREKVGEEAFETGTVRFSRQQAEKTKVDEWTGKTRYTLFGCDAGMKAYTISWDGKLLGCQTLGLFYTDARTLGLKKAWEQFPFTVKLPPANPKCRDCDLAEYCETCYASRYAETGSLNGCPDYQCQDAHEIKRLLEGGTY